MKDILIEFTKERQRAGLAEGRRNKIYTFPSATGFQSAIGFDVR
jgi:hypothetical protein